MPEVEHLPVIKRLPSQLANQIAAGEVIERPASVLKELLENALDAGATRIDIELTKGGLEHIVVTDDGYGIQADELPLAISRHATSKIEHIDDLLNLHSLGFRGEALASICSVSQWEIISRPVSESQAAQLSYLSPAQVIEINHAPGTRVSIRQLFHNTPARKKFLRAEQTEYRHCQDVTKRMALACFEVGFYLKHNGRQVLRLPAVKDDIGRSRRVAQVCGESFIQHAIVIDYPHNQMRLWGWISQADFSRQSSDLQYFYINGRIIRDRIINHALRSAYQHILPTGRHAAYVLHLDVDPAVVDINVHPTKHEVRFRESRVIHDFVSRSIRDALQQDIPGTHNLQTHSTYHAVVNGLHESSDAGYSSALAEHSARYQNNSDTRFGNVLAIVAGQFALTQNQERFFLLDMQALLVAWLQTHWQEQRAKNEIKSLPLLLPERLPLEQDQLEQYKQSENVLSAMGFDLHLLDEPTLLIRKIPSWLQYYDIVQLLQQFLSRPSGDNDIEESLFEVLKNSQPDYKQLDLNMLFRTLPFDDNNACWRELSADDLHNLLANK